MLQATAEDRERIAISWAMSFAITMLILTAFFFMRLSRSVPKTGPMELFVEVNYGTDAIGSGDLQTFNKANASKVNENMRREAETTERKSVATPPRPTPPAPRTDAVKPTTRATEKVITSKTESPVEEPERTETKKVASTTSSTSTPVAKAEPEKKINETALFKKSSGSTSGSNGTTGTKSGVGGNNNGDDASGVGDKGAKDGSLYSRNYKGGGGGGGTGVGLNLAGWGWSRPPVVNDNSDATGDITFKIVVGSNGRVKNVTMLNSTVTDYSVINQYKEAVRALTFIAKAGNVPEESIGSITFKIRSN
jgi:outer membrane biosynthesis protein TonB